MLSKLLPLLVASLVLLSGAIAFATPTDYVKEKTQKVTKILAKKESKTRAKQLDKLLKETIDFGELAKRSLGKHWEARTEEEKAEFLDLLQSLLQANYEKQLSGKRLGKDYKIAYVDEKTKGTVAIVKTEVEAKGEKKPVNYRLSKNDGKWVIYDVVIDDISLEETYRESYVEIIEEEGWGGLIKRMKDKVKEIKS